MGLQKEVRCGRKLTTFTFRAKRIWVTVFQAPGATGNKHSFLGQVLSATTGSCPGGEGLRGHQGETGLCKTLHGPTAAEKKAGEAITGHQRRYVERLSWDHDANTRTHCWVNNFLHKDGLFPTLLPLLGDWRRNSTGTVSTRHRIPTGGQLAAATLGIS